VGRVGGHILTAEHFRPSYSEVVENPIDYIWVSSVYGVMPDDSVQFQLSQRADHILKTIASRVRFNRALINPKWEHYYSHDMMTRLHLLFGESNQNEYAYALKVGSTQLAIQLMEDDLLNERFYLAQPLAAMRDVSRDPTYRWIVECADGRSISAIDLQREYLKAAELYRGCNDQTDWILDEWESVLDGLESDPMAMGDRIDWVAKRQIVESYREENGIDWSDDALHSVDLEYHNINPDQSLFHAWQEMGNAKRVCTELDILDAMTDAPKNTRAAARAKLVERVMKRKGPRTYMIDWSGVSLDRYTYVDLSDPFDPDLPAE
jgi:proteasome accessory factor A